jgi:signal transduction histidine kinase
MYREDQPVYFDVLGEARVLSVDQAVTDPRTKDLHEYLAVRSIASLLDVPVWLEGRLGGILCHEHVGKPRHWTTDDEEFAVGVGQVVGSALMARARTRASEAASRAAFLDDVSRVVSGSLEAREVGRLAVATVVPKLADAALIWTIKSDDTFECVAFETADQDNPSHVRAAIAGAIGAVESGIDRPFIAEKVVRECQSLLLPTFSLSNVERRLKPTEAQRALVKAIGMQSALGVPLAVGGAPFGALVLFGSRRQYGNRHLALAEDVALRVAAALENARHYAAAREAIRSRDEFLVLASHELRTPLASLQLQAQNMQRQLRRSGDEPDAAKADAMIRQVTRLGRLLDHMDEALNVRAQGISLRPETCELSAIVEGCVEHVGGIARSPITIEAQGPIVGQWDRRRMEQLFLALLENAIKFGDGKPIEVRLRQDGNDAVLTVRDHGMGIAPDRLAAIFSPFERAVRAEHFGGLGLGLYIAKAIAQGHGGSISVSSRVGEGSTFVVVLPLTRTAVAQPPS